MSDRSHLTPMRTLDRRGWATTVYRKMTGSGGAADVRPIPAPPVLAPNDGSGAARLPDPPRRSRREITALGRKLKHKAARRDYRKMVSTPEGRFAAELALETIDSGRLTERVTVETVAATCAVGAGLLTDCLRIAPPVLADIERRRGPGASGWHRDSFNGRVKAIIVGLRRRDPLGPAKATDDESLAAAVAVVLFIDRLSPRSSFRVTANNSAYLDNGVAQTRTYLVEEEVEQLVSDHPDQLDLLVEYAQGHDVSRPENVSALRALLEGEVAAPVADGWL